MERLNTERISESVGPAFARSGEALDQLGKDLSLAFSHSDKSAPTGVGQPALDMLEAGVVWSFGIAMALAWLTRHAIDPGAAP